MTNVSMRLWGTAVTPLAYVFSDRWVSGEFAEYLHIQVNYSTWWSRDVGWERIHRQQAWIVKHQIEEDLS